MDSRDGAIYTEEELKKLRQANPEKYKDMRDFLIPMQVPPTTTQRLRHPPTVEPYDPCPCGSGKKFKFCCKGKKVTNGR